MKISEQWLREWVAVRLDTRALADRLTRGLVLLIDYGFPEAEYYHPHRTAGTLV